VVICKVCKSVRLYKLFVVIIISVRFPRDCYVLQSDINAIQGWCIANCMELNISKTKFISFSRKTNVLIYDYKLCQSSITRTWEYLQMLNFISMTMSNIFSLIVLSYWV
jgi:hypothetical protein